MPLGSNPNLNETLADAVMDLPREFFINDKRFELWSPTLGMTILIDRHLSTLELNEKALKDNPGFEALRLCSIEKEKVCAILAIYTMREYSDLMDSRKRKEREKEFMSLSADELAKLFLWVLTEVKAETLISLTELRKEQETQAKIAQYKNKEGHNVSFGGKTVFGILIDTACAKYGWTKQYVVWEIDLISLRMMLADAITSIYLSEDEMKVLKINTEREAKLMIRTQADLDKIKNSMDWK